MSLTLRCCEAPSRADWRPTSETELRLPSFFLRRRNLPSAERSVDFLRCGGLLLATKPCAPASSTTMSLESMLAVENRFELDGLARWYRAGELLATAETAADEEPPPSEGLGPGRPGVFGRGEGEPGCSGTVCGTSIMSVRSVAVRIDWATEEKG